MMQAERMLQTLDSLLKHKPKSKREGIRREIITNRVKNLQGYDLSKDTAEELREELSRA